MFLEHRSCSLCLGPTLFLERGGAGGRERGECGAGASEERPVISNTALLELIYVLECYPRGDAPKPPWNHDAKYNQSYDKRLTWIYTAQCMQGTNPTMHPLDAPGEM